MPAMVDRVKDTFLAFFSRLFPRTHDVEVHVDASADGSYLFVDARLVHKEGSYHITDLKKIPARIKIGSKYVRVSQKNRNTLRHLADWDPAFDARKGFVFYEKDVPEILNYLRSKASLRFAENAEQITVDNRPLECVHDIRETNEGIERSEERRVGKECRL